MRTLAYVLSIVAGLAVAFCSVGCVESTTTAPDGTVTRLKQPAPGVLPFAAAAIVAYSPRPIVVREEKSGRISVREIYERSGAYGPWLPTPAKP